ncbi:hypothetical protein, partial [Nocardia tengchongensis]|uniref:hypothetical protein n=1 Tax=Nocardia tengchongensis TaxID=2055889 RepID=UPI0036AE8A22
GNVLRVLTRDEFRDCRSRIIPTYSGPKSEADDMADHVLHLDAMRIIDYITTPGSVASANG